MLHLGIVYCTGKHKCPFQVTNFFFIFSGMAKVYAAMHLGDYTDQELKKARDNDERTESMQKGVVFQVLANVWYNFSL